MAPKDPATPHAGIRSELPVRGGTLAYESAGNGSPVLFLHSAIADSRMWDRELARYSVHHRVVRFDQRGYGSSSIASAPFSIDDDIRGLLDHLGIHRTLVVGSSMGGAFAIDFALAHPERVQGLFLLAPGLSGGILPPFDAEEQAALEIDDAKSQDVAKAWSKGDAPAATEALRHLWCSALEGRALDSWHRMVAENLPEVFEDRSMQHAAKRPQAEPRLAEIHVPTTLLVGDRDNPSSPFFVRRIARGVPKARLVQVAGADHLVNLSRPNAFDAALDAALDESR